MKVVLKAGNVCSWFRIYHIAGFKLAVLKFRILSHDAVCPV